MALYPEAAMGREGEDVVFIYLPTYENRSWRLMLLMGEARAGCEYFSGLYAGWRGGVQAQSGGAL